MKTLRYAALAAAAAASSTPSQAITSTVGRLASSCYGASLATRVARSDLDACTRALDEEPLSFQDRVATGVNRGIVRMNLNDRAGADRDFDVALSMDQKEPEAWLNKGLLRLRDNKAHEAMPLIQRAIDAHTIRPALAIYARGIANEQLGNLRAAYDDLTQARDMAPGWKLPSEQLTRYRVR